MNPKRCSTILHTQFNLKHCQSLPESTHLDTGLAILGPFPGPGVLFEPGEGFTPPLGLGLLSSIDLFSCCCLDIHCGDTVDLLACPRILRKYKKIRI